ncbi:sulfite reductase subunit alpha [Halopseudomonas bauzanensis]|uniref:NADPH--hemoprotein reductase n=1 Tax=Halopseudomonas bauzanensis TaxID=653930 RepID=A0A4U0YHI1_9GAMM|nr:sulfite reductase subunit alpha [Halopseudomonas bauzanensis]TKA91422.1 oxidoreductase [Halopseudomonas bauzanensis]
MTELSPVGWLADQRLLWAALAFGSWLLLCWMCLVRPPRPKAMSSVTASDWLIAYASQSGAAQDIAERLLPAFHQHNLQPALLPLNALHPDALSDYSWALFIVSTYGEGEAPDNGASFWQRASNARPDLTGLDYSLLALGDRRYADFCGFGRQLGDWLDGTGAKAALPRHEADRLDTDVLHAWHRQISQWTGLKLQAPSSAPFSHWTLCGRTQLNPDSPGSPAWLIRLLPVGELPGWRAGDLAEVRIGSILRTYSIASLPEDGALELIVRQVVNDDGSAGQGSGWLCCHAEPGAMVEIQLRSNPGFHLPEDNRPGIFIGAGTGLAGLRGLLRQRQRLGCPDNWLLFGERCQQHDRWLAEELDAWTTEGTLLLDRCFSRAGDQPEYVQHRLAAKADQLRQWVDRGASIHVCGSLAGMGNEIHSLLQAVLSPQQWQALQEQQRYRRDLY